MYMCKQLGGTNVAHICHGSACGPTSSIHSSACLTYLHVPCMLEDDAWPQSSAMVLVARPADGWSGNQQQPWVRVATTPCMHQLKLWACQVGPPPPPPAAAAAADYGGSMGSVASGACFLGSVAPAAAGSSL
eukprot:CAMPEP_0202889680 /NCGR_PEP_ID=MMETSP1392-20130828/276_1 /ASSEMBLY_ACC=CAM_ASM_000868 /TAXON_ID=225041 /ORGANISM="Chlamydomonas chlamydogama, Strain SAG 11-48b" /LENGTH=131 /DNA_ID=CAMNT_0049573069 /DNA_START=846 /DNA_END=1241 /DNA_ORIENTATION=+